MKKLIYLIFLLTSCQNNIVDRQKTLETLSKTIDVLLQKKESHLAFYLGVKDSVLDRFLNASKEVKAIIETSSNDNNSLVLVKV